MRVTGVDKREGHGKPKQPPPRKSPKTRRFSNSPLDGKGQSLPRTSIQG